MDKITKSPYLFHDHLLTDLARIYSNEYKEPFLVMVGDFGDFDIANVDWSKRIEVKFETTPIRTNNVAIEYWNSDLNQPSGILATDANLWVHIIKESEQILALELDIDVLRKLTIETGELKDNGRNALIKCIPVDVIKKHAHRIFPFEFKYRTN